MAFGSTYLTGPEPQTGGPASSYLGGPVPQNPLLNLSTGDLYRNFADTFSSGLKDAVTSGLSNLRSAFSSAGSAAGSASRSFSGGASSKKAEFDFLNAELARHYGMNKATGYQEALSNTAYQRAVADLKAAGLNPVLAMGKVAPADSFYGSEASSGGGAAFAAGRGSRAAASSARSLWQLVGSAIGAAGGAVVGKTPSAAYVGGKLGGTITRFAYDAFTG